MTDDDDEGGDWRSTEERAADIAQARALKAQAREGGLRFEAYLPPRLAEWMLDLVERGIFVDPSEAVFVMMGEQQDMANFPELRQAFLRLRIEAAMNDTHPGYSAEEVFAHLEELRQRPRPEPAVWRKRRPVE